MACIILQFYIWKYGCAGKTIINELVCLTLAMAHYNILWAGCSSTLQADCQQGGDEYISKSTLYKIKAGAQNATFGQGIYACPWIADTFWYMKRFQNRIQLYNTAPLYGII